MSQENVEIVRRANDAYNRRDLDGMLEVWAPDGVLDWSNARIFDAGVYRGYGEIRAFAEEFLATWDEVRIEIVDGPVEVEDGLLIAENVAYLRGRNGIEVQARSAWLITIRDGEQTSLTLYQTKQEALEAAGLSDA
jgi:ketosteroid isomerase-like protein